MPTVTSGTPEAPADYATLATPRITNETWTINGGYMRVDIDTRYGLNGAAAASFGPMPLSATLGGTVEFNSTKVRLIPFDSGSGNVPANDTVISQGGASGRMIAVYSALNAAPTAVAAAMPASGFIKIRQWNSVSFTSGALTGIGASATAADGPGWIEVVGCDAGTCTVNRLNEFKVIGDWYTFQGATTSGVNTTTYQIPTNGQTANYFPGVWVETGTATNVYEFYPCAGSLAATAANMATDETRGKFCWITVATGVVRFQHDGTNSTGGYLPPSGRRIRIPNIFFVTAASAATTNNIPNATLATRYRFITTAAGAITMDKASINWHMVFAQVYTLDLSNVGVMTQITCTNIAQPVTWDHVGVGQEAANTQSSLILTNCSSGGTVTNCTWTRASAVATLNWSFTDVSGFTFTNNRVVCLLLRTGTAQALGFTRVGQCNFTGTLIGNGNVTLAQSVDLNFNQTSYYDGPAVPTTATNPLSLFNLSASCFRINIDGLDFRGLPLVQPYNQILLISAAGNDGIKLRNLGTAAAPLDLGGPEINATWTRSVTTATATTPVPHNMAVGTPFYVLISSDVAAITVAAKTVATAATATTFTFTCLNAGASSGTITYYPTISAQLVNIAAAANSNNIRVQRCYCPHTRTTLVTAADNANKGLFLESVRGDYINAPVSLTWNQFNKQITASIALTAQNSVYGTHWSDYYTTGVPANTAAQSWTRASTTATITSNDHGLRTNDLINVTVSSDTAAIVLGQKTITAITHNTFTFACLNAGATSGTLTYRPLHGRIALAMNEATPDTVNAYTVESGNPAFTSAGGLSMPNVGDQIVFKSLYNFRGHTGFPIAELVMAGGTLANYDITYSLNDGVTYRNLSYPRAGAGGASGSPNITMTSTTGVQVGDFIFGTNVAPNAKVVSITNATTIVADTNNTGTVSGTLRFNHLPNETVADAAVGFPLRIRIRTAIANSTAITSIFFYTLSTTASRQVTYPLDTITLSVTGLLAGSDVVVLAAGTDTILEFVDENPTSSWNYVYETPQAVDIGVLKAGYLPVYIRNYSLGAANASLPVNQIADRNYEP